MQPNTVKKILILGGSGFVGRHVCSRLSLQHHQITVPTRRLPARHIQMMPSVSVVQADVHDPQQLQALVHGHDVVINLVAILHGTEEEFNHAHVTLPANLARACHAEHVTRLIHISALGADVHGPSMYQRSKARGELALLSAAQRTPLGLTLLRPSVIFGKDDPFINLFAKLQKIFPVMPIAGAQTRFQPVWVHDVAQAIVHCVNTTSTEGLTYELCGPDVMTLAELVQLAGRWVGKQRPVLPLPYAIGWLQALLMEWAPGPTLMSRDNLDSMKVNNIASGKLQGLRVLGVAEPKSVKRLFVAGH
ncbi:complex I NDUFA9 subunit family protein [Limnohabitans sp.]|uniref:complex I NDUFA9 subunit family protein n=1 Tax=Limnohabitans sp. TaxID=1907725 RepID=UPI00286F0A90|nr:complex I NDUFA9 subunit family protein [Limnohabitans sp.]